MLKINLLLFLAVSLFSYDTSERNESTSHDVMIGSKPSDIPTGGMMKDFRPINKNMFTGVDLSDNPDARVFAGYGVYDLSGENCVDVDTPTADGTSADSKFTDFKVYNGHTYALSINNMTYDQCLAKAVNYNAYPAILSTPEENNAIGQQYRDADKWIGVSRDGSCPSEYVDSKGSALLYDGFYSKDEECSNTMRNVYMPSSSMYWKRAAHSDTRKCLIEFDTEDWKRPVRSCAPWWSIERNYLADSSSKYTVRSVDSNGDPLEVDIRNFNQANVPHTVKVCTRVDQNSASIATAGVQSVICNSYYDRTASPRCHDEPEQDVCKVDECRGAIKSKCTFVESSDAPLTYTKEPVFVDGEYKLIKKKVGIKMNKYLCPIQTKTDNCLESQTVIMLPQPCPGTDVGSDGNATKPIMVYGSPTAPGPNKYDASGKLINLYGECPDGTVVEVPVNVLKQDNKTCTKYAQNVTTKEYDEMCVSDRSSTDYTVETSLSEQDLYQNNPNCVRLNNIKEARPKQDVRIDYETFGMASLAIVKATKEGSDEVKFEQILPSLYYQNQMASMDFSESVFEQTPGAPTVDLSGIPQVDCSEYLNDGVDAYTLKLKKYKEDGVKALYDYSSGQIVNFGSRTVSQCQNIVAQYGGRILYGAHDDNATEIARIDSFYEGDIHLGSIAGVSSKDMLAIDANATVLDGCWATISENGTTGDKYKKVVVNSSGAADPDFNLYSAQNVTYEDCRAIAICSSSDILNANHYSGTQQCRLHKTKTSGTAATNELSQEQDEQISALQNEVAGESQSVVYSEDELQQRSTSGTLSLDQIDGLSDIYAIMEYTDFNFGYFSSYSSRIFKSDMVKVNNQIVMPIVEHPRITQWIREDYRYNYTKYRNYKLDAFSGFVLGVKSGGGINRANAATLLLNVGSLGTLATLTWAYNAIWGKDTISFTGSSYCEAYNYIDSSFKYIENPYGYETRNIYKKDGEDKQRIEYFDMSYGIDKKQNVKIADSYFGLWRKKKEVFYKELNIDMTNYIWPSYDKGLPVSDPHKCGWWEPWCKKTRNANAAGTMDTTKYHKREVSVHYMGATNTAVIVVPYKGDYELKAYNRHGDVISHYMVNSSMFLTSNTEYGTSMEIAQVKFGLHMPLSVNLEGNACRGDLMAEIGGGVSGAYYELGDTGTHTDFYCTKSDDRFVIDNSIVKISVRSTSQSEPFVIQLKKPMPYANRVFLGTLGYSEERVYRCYDSQYPECTSFTKVQK